MACTWGKPICPPRRCAPVVGETMLVGLSTHNLDQVKASASQPVDYIGFGPLYTTNSKSKPDPVVGPALLPQAAALAAHPHRRHRRPG